MLIRSITQNTMDNELFEILTVENVGIGTQTKYLESLIRKIKKVSIRQFPSAEHPYIVFQQKNLAVLDISRFTFCKVDYKWIRRRMQLWSQSV